MYLEVARSRRFKAKRSLEGLPPSFYRLRVRLRINVFKTLFKFHGCEHVKLKTELRNIILKKADNFRQLIYFQIRRNCHVILQ